MVEKILEKSKIFNFVFSFICSKCRLILRNNIFYSKDNLLYCQQCMNDIEPCIMTLKSSQFLHDQCQKCGKTFLLGETISMYHYDFYHPDCFRCGNCRQLIVSQGFFRQEDGCFYCLNCHIENGPHCYICKEPFLTGEIRSQFNGKQFHKTSFLCQICRQTIEMKQFYNKNGKVVCENCLNKSKSITHSVDYNNYWYTRVDTFR
jgi:hypothetical protein